MLQLDPIRVYPHRMPLRARPKVPPIPIDPFLKFNVDRTITADAHRRRPCNPQDAGANRPSHTKSRTPRRFESRRFEPRRFEPLQVRQTLLYSQSTADQGRNQGRHQQQRFFNHRRPGQSPGRSLSSSERSPVDGHCGRRDTLCQHPAGWASQAFPPGSTSSVPSVRTRHAITGMDALMGVCCSRMLVVRFRVLLKAYLAFRVVVVVIIGSPHADHNI